MDDDVITATCVAFPDGTIHWAEAESCDVDKIIAAWMSLQNPDQRADIARHALSVGSVQVRMLRTAYHALPATNDPLTLALTYPEGFGHA